MAVSPAGIDESTFIWNPNPIPLFAALAFAGAIVARRTGRARWWLLAGVGAMATMQLHILGAVILVPLAWAWVADVLARGARRRRRGPDGRRSGAGSAPSLIVARGLPAAARFTSSGTASPRRARSSTTSRGGGREAAGGAARADRHRRAAVDHLAVRRRDHGPRRGLAATVARRSPVLLFGIAVLRRGRRAADARDGPGLGPLAPRRRSLASVVAARPVRAQPRDGDARACPTTTTTTSSTRSWSPCPASGSRASPRPSRPAGPAAGAPPSPARWPSSSRDRRHRVAAGGVGGRRLAARRPGRGPRARDDRRGAARPRRDPAVQERERDPLPAGAPRGHGRGRGCLRGSRVRGARVRPAVRRGRVRAVRRPGRGGLGGDHARPSAADPRGAVRRRPEARPLGLRRATPSPAP